MEWIRKGLIYKPATNLAWMQSHAQVPFAYPLESKTVRFYFATRDGLGRSNVAFIESDIEDLQKVNRVSHHPALSPGVLGSFDDSGTMPSWFIKNDNEIYLYYTAWNLGGTVSYRLSIGLAISKDGGETFIRYKNAPILDRSEHDLSWVAQPCVMKNGEQWKMWYLSCDKWEMINGHPEPFYHVKYAESNDGIHWERNGHIAVDYDDFTDAIGRPSIIYENGIYKMFYSYRNATDYRTSPEKSYRLGYAESTNGKDFTKRDDNFIMIGERDNWESIMNAYGHVVQVDNQTMIFYNGNGFGETGFGYAILKK